MPIIGSASVQIRAIDKFFERDVRAAVRKIKNVEIELKADVDLTKVNKKLRDLRYRMRNNVIQLNIDAQTETIEEDFQRIVDTFHNRTITVQGTADTAVAEAQLSYAARNRRSLISASISPETRKALQGLFYTITGSIPFDKVKAALLGLAGNFEGITLKAAAVTSVISALTSSLFALTGSVFTLGSDIADVIGLTAALPAGIFMFGTAIAAATISWKGFASAVTGKGKKGSEALANLPLEAQEAALAIRGLGKEIATPVKKAFWVELDGSLQSMVKTTVPALKAGLTETAVAMGGLTKDAFQSMEKFVKSNGLSTMFDGSNQGLQNMRKGVDPLITALGQLGVVGSKFLPQFGNWLGDLGVQFGNFIDRAGEDRISGWISDAVTSVQLLGSSVASVTKIFSGISNAATEAGFGGLRAFSEGLAGAAEVANREPFRSQLVNFFRAARDASKTLNASIGNLFKTFGQASQVLGGFFREGSEVVAAFINNITSMLKNSNVLGGLYTGIADFRQALVRMEPGFINLGNIIGSLAEIAGTVFKAMAPGFNDLMDTLDQIFANLVPGLQAVVPIFNEFVQNVLAVVSGPLIALADGIGKLLEGFSGMPEFLQGIVLSFGAMLLLAPKLTAAFALIGGRFTAMRVGMAADGAALTGQAARLSASFAAMRTGFVNAGGALRTIPFAAATGGIRGVATSLGAATRAAGAGGFRGAIGGASALLGGPWGIALAAGVGLIAAFGQAQAESNERVNAFSQTLDQQTGTVTNATKALVASTALDGVTDGWDDFFRGVLQQSKSVEETLDTLGISTEEFTKKLSDESGRESYVKGFEKIRDELRRGAPITDEMAAAIGRTKESLKGLSDDDIAHLATKARNAADELTKAEEKTRKLAAATGITSASAKVFAKNLETLGDAGSSASDKFSALKSNLDILDGGMRGIVDTKKALAQALDDTRDGLATISDEGKVSLNALYSIKEGFDFTSQAGRDFHTELDKASDAILRNGTQALDQALKSGKSAADANSIAIQAMQPGVKALRDQLANLGVEQPKIDEIIRSFGLMPDQIATAITVEGTEEAQRKIFLTKLAADAYANGNFAAVLGALPQDAMKAIADTLGKSKEYAEGDYESILKALDETKGGRAAALASLLSVTNGNYEAAIKALDLTLPGVTTAKTNINGVEGKSVKIVAEDHTSATLDYIKRNIAGVERYVKVTVDTVYNNRAGSAGNAVSAFGADGAVLNSVTNKSSLFTGKFPMQKFANGGIENHTAQIAKAGAMRLWAEPETGGEAYIPLAKAKRERSLKILEEVARIFGFGLTNLQMANGGTVDKPAVSSQSSVTATAPHLSLTINPSQGLSEKQIGEAAMAELYWQLSNR